MDEPTSSTEIELTLRVSSQSAARLKRHELLSRWRTGKTASRRLLTTYFDTPDFALREHKMALRVRKVGRRHVQTVKAAAPADQGLLTRIEDERVVPASQPDVQRVAHKKLRRFLSAPEIGERLAPVFVTDFRRAIVPLSFRGSQIEMAIDQGAIETDSGQVPISEVELELKRGIVADVYEVARALSEVVPVAIEPLSKAERGYAMIAGEPPPPCRASALELDPEGTVGAAFRLIGHNCLQQFRANLASVQAAVTPEGVHQLRVSIRRLRSALHAFRKLLPPEERARVVDQVRWVMQACAPARAWDVFVEECLDPLRDHLPEDAPHEAMREFAADVEVMREAAQRRVVELIANPKFTATCLELEAWWESGAAMAMLGEAAALPIVPFARDTIRSLARRLRAEAKGMEDRRPEELHDFRIQAKKLRYAAEFFRSLFRRKATKAYLGALASLQDRLGSINDAITAQNLLDELERERPPAHPDVRARARATISGWASARIAEDLRALPELWGEVAALKPFWR